MEILDIFDQEWVTEVTKIENERIAKEMAEKAAKEAAEKAAKEERINTILSLYKDGFLDQKVVCQRLEISEDELKELLLSY